MVDLRRLQESEYLTAWRQERQKIHSHPTGFGKKLECFV
jgi:hypothetical protein